MKFNRRDDRDLRQTVKETKPYESRKSIKRRFDVNQVVNNFAKGLDGFGDNHAKLLDKYYMPSHIPTRDILTELSGIPKKSLKTVAIAIAIALGLFLLLRTTN